MKILLCSASPRKEKSQTFQLAQEVVRGCGEDSRCEVVHLCDLGISFCRHCEVCHKNILACPLHDDVGGLITAMLASDGIIFATPNYINQVTGALKAVFDRSAHFIHCKRLLGKYVAGVVTSGSGHDKEVLDYLRYYAHACGAQYSGGVSSRVPVSDDARKAAFELGRLLRSDILEQKKYPEQQKILEAGKEHFARIMQIRKKEWAGEYQYWQERKWL